MNNILPQALNNYFNLNLPKGVLRRPSFFKKVITDKVLMIKTSDIMTFCKIYSRIF